MHRIAAYMFLALFLVGSVQASERGITRSKLQVTTQDGETLEMYTGSHALLIGISDYTVWPRLDNIPSELDEVANALEAQNFNIVRLINPNGRELSNGIEDFIDEYGYEPENRLLIYFAGHGHSVGDKGFIIPADTPLPEHKNFRRSIVPMSRVLSWARDMEAKHALFVFDSCFAGTVFKSRNLPDTKERYIRRATALPVRQFITAGSANQEVPAKSTFTPALISAINGEGDLNNDGYVTGSELGVHLSQLVPLYTNQNPQYGKIRDFDLAQGDFVFFKQEINILPSQESASNQSLEALLWKSAEQGNTTNEYKAYLSQYPQGIFAGIAKARIDKLIETKKVENPAQSPELIIGRLTVRVDLPDARVRIMNIVPPYFDGIELEQNKRYHIVVTKEGYKTYRRWINLTESNQVVNVSLVKKKNLPQDLESQSRYVLTNEFQSGALAASGSAKNPKNNYEFAFQPRSEGARNQEWIITADGRGFYRIVNREIGDKWSLDVVNDGARDRLKLAKSGDYTGQRWQFTPLENGYCRLTTRWLGYDWSLDVTSDTIQPTLTMRTTGNFGGQHWSLKQLGPKSGELDSLCPGH